MSLVVCAASALTVAGLFYSLRSYNLRNECRHKLLRERVTYMLWVMVNGRPETE